MSRTVTAILPVRSGSTRCLQKNNRPFGDTNLLEFKISILKKVRNISQIIVSSSDEEYLKIARRAGVSIHERDPLYSTSDTTGSDLYRCLAKAVPSEYMMYVTCVSPFVVPTTMEHAIDLFFDHLDNGTYDSVISCQTIKEFLWLDGKALNYNPKQTPPSQLLPDIKSLTFGFNIIKTNFVEKTKSIVGERPYFYELSQFEGIDIDTPFDFTVAEMLYKNAFRTNNDIVSHSEATIEYKFKILDCTIRDGGYLNNWQWEYSQVLEMYKALSLSGIDFMEIGFICTDTKPEYGRWWNVSKEDIKQITTDYDTGCKLAAMINLEHLDRLHEKIDKLDMIRILVNPKKNRINSEIQDSITRIMKLGYQVTLNIAYADILKENELALALSLIVPGITCVYIADTFGSLTPSRMKYIFHVIREKHVPIGFHGHDNINRAIANTLEAIENGVSYVDTTLLGKGRGGGNTPTEYFILHSNHTFATHYDITPILEYLESETNDEQKLAILHTYTGLKKIHPNMANDALNNSGLLKSAYEELCN
jgi:CMP-N-acetylneuraminic acid synthetase